MEFRTFHVQFISKTLVTQIDCLGMNSTSSIAVVSSANMNFDLRGTKDSPSQTLRRSEWHIYAGSDGTTRSFPKL